MRSDGRHPEVVDADIDLHDPAQRDETRPREWDLIAAVALGGVLGAEARYGLGRAWPHRAGTFPWTSLWINVSGCLLLGVLMVLVLDVIERPHRLLRPFLGVGVLGGFTTFSTFALDIERLLESGHVGTALAYVAATLVLGQIAVHLATAATRRLAGVTIEPVGEARR